MRALTVEELVWVSGGDLPEGYTPVGDGSHYMQDSSGTYYLTPSYEAYVNDAIANNWGIDQMGIALDLVFIASSGVAIAPGVVGMISNWIAFASGSLKVMLGELKKAITENNERPRTVE